MPIVDAYRELCSALHITNMKDWRSFTERTRKDDIEGYLRTYNIRPEQHNIKFVRQALEQHSSEERTPEQEPSVSSMPVLHYPQCSPIIRSSENFRVADDVILHLEERLAIHHFDDSEEHREYMLNRLREWNILRESNRDRSTNITSSQDDVL